MAANTLEISGQVGFRPFNLRQSRSCYLALPAPCTRVATRLDALTALSHRAALVYVQRSIILPGRVLARRERVLTSCASRTLEMLSSWSRDQCSRAVSHWLDVKRAIYEYLMTVTVEAALQAAALGGKLLDNNLEMNSVAPQNPSAMCSSPHYATSGCFAHFQDSLQGIHKEYH